jgi:hypothetical protein
MQIAHDRALLLAGDDAAQLAIAQHAPAHAPRG